MTAQPTTPYEDYAIRAAENYERDFVPVIGRPFAERLLDASALKPGEHVLDIACGTGVAARLAAEAAGPTGTVTGIDANPAMLEVARRTDAPAPIEWKEGAAEQLPVADGSVDVALCSLGFMFFGDKLQALREMRRVLTPGGRAILGTPGPTPPLFDAIGQALIAHVGPGASMFVHAVFSVHEPAEVKELLDGAEFEAVGIEKDAIALRVPPPAEFFWQYVHSTPLAAIVGELEDGARAALEAEVVERCQPFVEGDGMVMEPGVLFATARRGIDGTR